MLKSFTVPLSFMSRRILGVIGGAGAMGNYMANIFSRHGYKILISDKDEDKANAVSAEKGYDITNSEDLAKSSDIVMFSIPIPETPNVIRKYGNLIRPNSLATDVTSRKIQAVNAMIESTHQDVEIVSMHPMFRPTVSPEGQQFILIPIRPKENGKWYSELESVLYSERAVVKRMENPEIHDKTMDIIQGLAHTKHMLAVDTMMKLLEKYGISLKELMEFSTAFYAKTFDLDGRLVAGNPDLYVPIQTESEHMPEVLEVFMESLSEHIAMVANKDSGRFNEKFLRWKQFMGNYATDASQRTDKLIGKPTGLEIFYEKGTKDFIENKLERKLDSREYKLWLESCRIKEGLLSRLKSDFVLAQWTPTSYSEENNGGDRDILDKEATVRFFVRNRMHPQHPEKKSGFYFTPIVPLKFVNDPNFARVQMYNRFQDEYLNLFNTYRRMPELKESGPLIAYKTQK